MTSRDAIELDELLELPPPRPRSNRPRIAHVKSLDGLRGIAVLAVVLYHFAPGIAPGGFLGVDIFFVLSGFLITSLLVSEFDAWGRISLAAFWIRRARRLLPALFLVLAVVGIYALALPDRVEGQHLGSDGLAAFGYVANWHFIASSQSYIQQFINRASPLRHTWSLAIEEQFYLVWPLLVAGLGALMVGHAQRRGRSRRQFRRALVVVCLGLAGISLFAMVSLYSGGDPSRVYYGTDTHAHVLLVGAALGALTAGALSIKRRVGRASLVVTGCAVAPVLGVAIALLSTSSTWLYRGGYVLVAVAVALLLAAAAQPGFNPLRRLLETRVLVGLGLISYGVYLWHWPAAVWLTEESTGLTGPALFALRAGVTLAASLASYRFVEQPIRRGKLPRPRQLVPGVVPMAAITVVAALLEVPALAFPSVAAVPASGSLGVTTAAVTAAYTHAPRCDPHAANGQPAVASGHPVRVDIVGNSYAGETDTCLGQILQAHGGSLTAYGEVGFTICEPSVVARIRKRASDPKTRPDAAIVFAFPPPALPASWQRRAQIRCLQESEWVRAFDTAISIWKRAGTRVYLVPDPPPAGQSSFDRTARVYRALARRYPDTVRLLDAGVFLRDSHGTYQWRMPCVTGGEVGCASDGTIPVRFPTDGGFHFCADPNWKSTACTPRWAGGERRVAAAMAAQLLAGFSG